MLKKEIKYIDFNGDERIETFYFNLTKTELTELDIESGGTLVEALKRMINTQDAAGLALFFKNMIIRSYGEKSDDGRYFEKGENYALGKRFTRSNAFDVMFTELLSDSTGDKVQAFIYGVIPPEIAAQAKAETTPKVVVGDFDAAGNITQNNI